MITPLACGLPPVRSGVLMDIWQGGQEIAKNAAGVPQSDRCCGRRRERTTAVARALHDDCRAKKRVEAEDHQLTAVLLQFVSRFTVLATTLSCFKRG